MTFTVDQAMGVIETANQDCHKRTPVEIKPEDIGAVLYFDESCGCGREKICGSFCDTSSMAVVTLKDGRAVLAREDSDSSGHG